MREAARARLRRFKTLGGRLANGGHLDRARACRWRGRDQLLAERQASRKYGGTAGFRPGRAGTRTAGRGRVKGILGGDGAPAVEVALTPIQACRCARRIRARYDSSIPAPLTAARGGHLLPGDGGRAALLLMLAACIPGERKGATSPRVRAHPQPQSSPTRKRSSFADRGARRRFHAPRDPIGNGCTALWFGPAASFFSFRSELGQQPRAMTCRSPGIRAWCARRSNGGRQGSGTDRRVESFGNYTAGHSRPGRRRLSEHGRPCVDIGAFVAKAGANHGGRGWNGRDEDVRRFLAQHQARRRSASCSVDAMLHRDHLIRHGQGPIAASLAGKRTPFRS